jgi:hypothetical protein
MKLSKGWLGAVTFATLGLGGASSAVRSADAATASRKTVEASNSSFIHGVTRNEECAECEYDGTQVWYGAPCYMHEPGCGTCDGDGYSRCNFSGIITPYDWCEDLCGLESEPSPQEEKALRNPERSDVEILTSLIENNPAARLNTDRSAIQFVAKCGGIYSSYPLPRSLSVNVQKALEDRVTAGR